VGFERPQYDTVFPREHGADATRTSCGRQCGGGLCRNGRAYGRGLRRLSKSTIPVEVDRVTFGTFLMNIHGHALSTVAQPHQFAVKAVLFVCV
jgi:hypothetical protein